MPSADTTVTRWDLAMSSSEFSVLANMKGFAATKFFPIVGVENLNDKFGKLKLDSLNDKPIDTRRAADGSYREGTFEFTEDTYHLDDHGLQEKLDRQQKKRYGHLIRSDVAARIRLVHNMMLGLENDVITLLSDSVGHFANGPLGDNSARSTAVSVPWSTAATATPLANINAAASLVEPRTGGLTPNTLFITKPKWRDLLATAEMKSYAVGGGGDARAPLTVQQVAQLLGLERIVFIGGYYRSSATANTAFWNNTVGYVGYVSPISPGADLTQVEPTPGYTLITDDGIGVVPGAPADGGPPLVFEEWYDPNVRADKLRARNYRGIKTLQMQCLQRLTNL